MTIRRDLLDKYWSAFLLNRGRPYEPMSENAYEYLEQGMEDYAELRIKEALKKEQAPIPEEKQTTLF